MKICNAQITESFLGKDPEIGIFTWYVALETDEFWVRFGNRALDYINKQSGKRQGTALNLSSIIRFLETLDLNKWEDLKGTFVRCQFEDTGMNPPVAIGHLIKEQWFNFVDLTDEQEKWFLMFALKKRGVVNV